MVESVTNVDNSSALANSLFTALTAGLSFPAAPDFSDPKYDITPADYTVIAGASLTDVTSGELDGTGSFDVFMKALDLHLEKQYKANRITGAQYAEVYTAVANNVMGQAVAFALQKDNAKWAAVTAERQARIAEIEAVKALVDLERVKFEATKAQFDANLSAAQYSLTKMQTATEEAQHDSVTEDVAAKQYNRNFLLPAELAIQQYQRDEVLPVQVEKDKIQRDRVLPSQAAIAEYENQILQPLQKDIQTLQRDRMIPADAGIKEFELNSILPVKLAQEQHVLNKRQPAETTLINEQIEVQRAQTLDTRTDGLTAVSGVIGLQKVGLDIDNDTKSYILSNQLPTQVTLLNEQITLTQEQGEAERAKTLDTRSDGVTTVVGSVGKQKDLYTQQIDSFVKEAQHKTAKMYLDGWITQKTLDEGLTAPTQLTNTEVNEVLTAVRGNNSLGS